MEIVFYKTSDSQPAAEHLAKTIGESLTAGQKVLWLVPGGSAIKVAVKASQLLDEAKTSNLIIGLTDERFGPVGHPDSNWQQLKEAGFKYGDAQQLPVLRGQDLAKTAEEYAAKLKLAIDSADYKIGLFGIGADGHTAGIKPNSPATDSNELYIGYEWTDFTRLTMGPKAIARFDEALVYAIGQEKKPQLEALSDDRPGKSQPAQFLKTVSKLTIFNDQVGKLEIPGDAS